MLIKTFIFGMVLGAAAVGAYLFLIPAVDLAREHSLGEPRVNGGVSESYHVELSTDRVLAGIAGAQTTIPLGLEWPSFDFLAGTQTEVFKVRNAKDKVVGVASRVVGGGDNAFVEWVVHMPARGTMYMLLPNDAIGPGVRVGALRGGTREFATLSGSVTERYIADTGSDDSEAAGRLELVTSLVSPALEQNLPEGEYE